MHRITMCCSFFLPCGFILPYLKVSHRGKSFHLFLFTAVSPVPRARLFVSIPYICEDRSKRWGWSRGLKQDGRKELYSFHENRVLQSLQDSPSRYHKDMSLISHNRNITFYIPPLANIGRIFSCSPSSS